jgi:hypothetical protein
LHCLHVARREKLSKWHCCLVGPDSNPYFMFDHVEALQTYQCAFPIIQVCRLAALSTIVYVYSCRGAIAALDVNSWIMSLQKINSVVLILELSKRVTSMVFYSAIRYDHGKPKWQFAASDIPVLSSDMTRTSTRPLAPISCIMSTIWMATILAM